MIFLLWLAAAADFQFTLNCFFNFKNFRFFFKVSKIKLVNVKKKKLKTMNLLINIPDSYFSNLIENNINKNIRLYASGNILYDANISKIIALKD